MVFPCSCLTQVLYCSGPSRSRSAADGIGNGHVVYPGRRRDRERDRTSVNRRHAARKSPASPSAVVANRRGRSLLACHIVAGCFFYRATHCMQFCLSVTHRRVRVCVTIVCWVETVNHNIIITLYHCLTAPPTFFSHDKIRHAKCSTCAQKLSGSQASLSSVSTTRVNGPS